MYCDPLEEYKLKIAKIFIPEESFPAVLVGNTALTETAWSYLYTVSNTAIKAYFISIRLVRTLTPD